MDVPSVCPKCGTLQGARSSEELRSTLTSPPHETDPEGTTVGRATPAESHSSVLDSLAASVGPIPRITLRETEEGLESPLVKPRAGSTLVPVGCAGRLELLGEIAHGGMGAVLKGHDSSLGRDLAVKVLLDKHMDRPELILRFVEEAQIAGQLQHPGIAPVYELGTLTDRRPFFSMKLVKGRTLAELLRERRNSVTDLSRLLGIFSSMCQTMAYAHARGVIHRDLKPSNVMIGSFGEVQVMDWGLAKVLSHDGEVADTQPRPTDANQTVIATIRSTGDSDLSQAGSVMGTPAYMAPEQAAGDVNRVDERSDVFALGSILCEILTGQPAFAARTTGELRRKAARADTSDALVRLGACSGDADLVCLAKECLAMERDDRPPNAGIVAERMTAYLTSVQDRLHQTELARVAAETRAGTERTRRRLTLALAASIVGLFALGGGGWMYVERQRAARQETLEEAINERIDHASVVQGKAAAAPIGDLASWAEALSEIKGAEDLLRHAEHDPDLAIRVTAVRSQVERGRTEAIQRAREAEADRRLVAHLETVRTDRGEHWDPARTDREFVEAFREYGVDLETMDPKRAGAALTGRAASVEIAAALDDWCAIREYDLAGQPNARSWKGLAEAARVADPDSWRNMLRKLYDQPLSEGLGFLKERAADAVALEKLPAPSLLLLAHMLLRAGAEQESAGVLQIAWRRFPGDFWVNHTLGMLSWTEAGGGGYRRPDEAARYLMAVVVIRPESASGHTNLGAALHDKGDLDGAIAEQREAIRLQPDNAGAHTNLGEVLRRKGKLDEAIAAHREALRLEPGIAEVHTNLGRALSEKGDHNAAIHELREAIRLKPTLAIGHSILGHVLSQLGNRDGAMLELQEALRLQPDLAVAHDNLGKVSLAAGKLDAAITSFRDAVRYKPDNAVFHVDLSEALRRKGDLDGAIEVIREALRLQHDDASAHTSLALALTAKGYLEGAIIEFREALRHHPDDAPAHVHLAKALRSRGQYAQAVEQLRQALELAGDKAEEQLPGLSRLLIEFEHEAALAARLPAVLRGVERPRDASDAFELARVARAESKFAGAARLSAHALSAKAEIADDVKTGRRYQAACLAALAGCGQGRDDPVPDAGARETLRKQALEWLRADLKRNAAIFDGADASTRKEIAERLARWQKDPDLAGVRDDAKLAALPRQERQAWKDLWSDVDAMREKALENKP